MAILSMEKAQEQLSQLPEQLAETAEEHTLTITRQGKPVLAVMSWEFYESLMETVEIMGDDSQMAALRQSIGEADSGDIRPWEEIKAEFGW
ncbi:MAG: type II toxin-antitoxin system Phd/YefM family antitoxin [Chloroflexota bacterium]